MKAVNLDQAFEDLKSLAESEVRNSSRKTAETLHQNIRRLRAAKDEREVAGILAQGRRLLCVTFEGENARIHSGEFRIHDAPALVSAIETSDTVVTSASRGELSEPLYLALDAEERVHLIPVVVGGSVRMVLAAADLDHTAELETLCEAAGLRLEAAEPKAKTEDQLSRNWEELPAPDQSLHLRAQRFAQVAVAKMRVEHAPAVREGMRRSDLYGALREQIDKARAEYKEQFLSGQSKTMVDYLYVELLRRLASDDDRMLGAGFPGRLI